MRIRSRFLPAAVTAMGILAPCAGAAEATIVNETKQNLMVEVADTEEIPCVFPGEPATKVKGRFVLHQNNRCTLKFSQNPRFKVGPVEAMPENGNVVWLDEFYTEMRIWRCTKDKNSMYTYRVSTAGLGDTITLEKKK